MEGKNKSSPKISLIRYSKFLMFIHLLNYWFNSFIDIDETQNNK